MGLMAQPDIEFVDIPFSRSRVIGEADEGTRVFRQLGREREFESWWDTVSELCAPDGSVSPGGASMFAPVSRAAVYKRLKEGRLTAFMFHWVPKGKRWSIKELFGPHGEREVMCVPVVELRQWGDLLKDRRGAPLPEEFDDKFLELKREKLREYIRKRDNAGQ